MGAGVHLLTPVERLLGFPSTGDVTSVTARSAGGTTGDSSDGDLRKRVTIWLFTSGLAFWWHDGAVTDTPRPDALAVPHPDRFATDHPGYDACLAAHAQAVEAGELGYFDPANGLFVMTASYLLDRGFCCDRGCRHCPWLGGDA